MGWLALWFPVEAAWRQGQPVVCLQFPRRPPASPRGIAFGENRRPDDLRGIRQMTSPVTD
jgi:hypothetical protein